MQKTCFFIGLMASGKTYWGRRISQEQRVPFIDLDDIIAAAATKPVHSIFADQGETHFRELERRTLREITLHHPCIVATGGGTPCFYDNMDWMNAHGKSIYLETPVDVILARLRLDQTVRPLLQGISEHELEAFLTELLQQREPWYKQAQVVLPYSADNQLLEKQILDNIRADS